MVLRALLEDCNLLTWRMGGGLYKKYKSMSPSVNIARIANAVPVTLHSRVTMNIEIVALNCQKCNQCLKCHKSLRLVFEGVL